jgi:uncharacterized protein (DUF885 family)
MGSFDELVAAYHEHFTRNPNACIHLGVAKHRDRLPDPSLASAEATVADARELLASAYAVERAGLSFDDSLDLDLAILSIEAEIHDLTYTFNGKVRLAQQPTAGDDIGDGIFLLFANDPRPAAERLADITGRVEEIPAYIEALLTRLDTPVARWVDMDVEKVEGLPTLFGTLVGWAEGEGFADVDRLKTGRAAAEQALEQYVTSLRGLPTTTQIHAGDDVARKIVALRGIEASLEDLHAMATRFLSDTKQTLETLRGRLVAKYELASETTVDELHTYLNERFRVKVDALDDILDVYRAEHTKIVEFIEKRELFPMFSEQALKILRTPSFMEPSIPAGAMVQPPAFRDGVRTSLIYLTLSEELRDEHTEISIPGMMIHEGVPGHHLQLATASRHASVIRRHFEPMDHNEGWTTMLEDYMLDVGYVGDLTDEVRFCGKRDLSRIGARVAIDLFFMTGDRDYLDVGAGCDVSHDDPFEAAGSLLVTVTGFTAARVQGELNWYSQERGYPLSYLTGNTLVWSLKSDIVDAQEGSLEGEALDREFHRIYLESGNMPVAFLRRVFEHSGLLS